MSDGAEDRASEKQSRVTDVEALIREIQRYLDFLDALRMSNPPDRRDGGRSGT